MGCDIHICTEVKKDFNDEEYWWCCDHFKYNNYKRYDAEEPSMYIKEIYNGRNYELFTALADVRHCNGINVISKPKGLPEDVSEVVKKESDSWGIDGHSHSWLTARELFIYQNKNPYTKHSGMVYGEDLERLKKDGIPPKWWCGWTSDSSAEYCEWIVPGSVVDELVECVKKRMAEEFWIFDFLSEEKKEEKYWEFADSFRIVFWFDN